MHSIGIVYSTKYVQRCIGHFMVQTENINTIPIKHDFAHFPVVFVCILPHGPSFLEFRYLFQPNQVTCDTKLLGTS